MRRAAMLQRFVDPLNACITTVAGLLLLALVCATYVVWAPLGLVGLLIALAIASPVRRATGAYLFRFRGEPKRRLYAGLIAVGVIASVPFAMAFLQTDLQALAATATANAQWQGPDSNESVLQSLYGSNPTWPSYGKCQELQNTVGRDLANGCYSTVGYLRSWQIPTAIPVMLCLTSLYCGIPLFVARHINQSAPVASAAA